MTTAPVPVVPEKKKTIVIDPGFLNAVYQALLKTDVKAEGDEFNAALDEAKKQYGMEKNYLWYYQQKAKTCASKEYTTEDQKQAGCLGTDTLNQCSAKMFDHCFRPYKNHQFLIYRKKLLEATDRLDKAMKAYTGKLKMIPEPK